MAQKQSSPSRSARRVLVWLGVILIALTGTLASGTVFSNASWMPKLALDLEGGTQIILAADVEDSTQVTSEQLNQAVSIIRQRVDSSGVSEAEVSTQGGNNVVVAVPGEIDDATRERIEASAQLQFRPVIVATDPATSMIGEDGEETPFPSPDPELESTPTAEPTDASDLAWVTPALEAELLAYDCENPAQDLSDAPSDQPLITCDQNGGAKYILGPVELTGSAINDATAGMQQSSTGANTGQWAVNLDLDREGSEIFADISQRLFNFQGQGAQNQFAFVLDGEVLSAPTMQTVITDGNPSISGTFTQDSAQTLADQLKYGALPISFEVQSSDTISATLGASQLQLGLIAGIVGLLVVFGYMLWQYRLLGFVTIASLLIAFALTYLALALLSWRQGYRLSLAGVAGVILSIGFTADSFIVYFERIRDELRDGRGLESAIEAAWRRAKRTIYASKAVSILSAVVLYLLAVGNVRGFAFTLGLTTLIDILVVVMFTHPMMRLLARTRFFASGHPASGLDPHALGAVYRGRAQFRAPVTTTKREKGSGREAQRRQTIAERKREEAAIAAGETGGTAGTDGRDR